MMNDGRFAEYFDGETKKEILDSKAELEDVVDHSLQVFKEKFVFFKEHIAVGGRALR